MKTSIIIAGVLVAAISAFAITSAQAQVEPNVKVIPASEQDMIKVIYAYESAASIDVRFLDADKVLFTDQVKAKNFSSGFMRKYSLEKFESKELWVEVISPELTVTYKLLQGENGRWLAQLEKATYTYPVVASR